MRQNATDLNESYMLALLQKPDITAAAESLGVARSTLYRAMNDPEFKSELDRRRGEVMEGAVGTIRNNFQGAAATLADLLECTDERVRRMAAKDILDYGFKILETSEVVERLERLEQALEAHG